MRHRAALIVLAGLVWFWPSPAAAKRIMIEPPAIRAARAQAILTGKVTGFEQKTTLAVSHYGGNGKLEYKVAIVKIDESLVGIKGLTHVKVGFVPEGAPRRAGGPVNLVEGSEGVFLLHAHPEAPFYIVSEGLSFVDKKVDGYKAQLDEIKKVSTVLSDPKKALQNKDALARLQAATWLIHHYRSWRPGTTREQTVDAEVSKLLLTTLAEADWGQPRLGYFYAPSQLFSMLGIGERQGFTAPQDYRLFPEAARKWLKENAGKFVVQRIVGPTEKK